MSAPLEPRLVALALRRALQPALLLPFVGLALLLALVDWRAGPGVAELPAQAARGLARQAVWLGGLAFLFPALCLHAARVVPRWREGDAAWLAPRRLGALAGLASSWCGTALGALVGLGILALAGEWAAAGDAPTWRPAGELLASEAAPLADGTGWRWALPDPAERAPAGSRLRVAFDLQALIGPSGPGAEARLSARRQGAADETAVGGRFTRAAELEVPVPVGPGALELELRRIGIGAELVPAGARVALLVPATSERAGVLAFAVRLALALAGALGLALGLGAWLSAPSAAILTGLALAAPALSPAAGLGEALDALGRGLAPPAAGARVLLGALLFAAFGLGLGRAGERVEGPR